jgi:DNA-binding CsgD family transcriptional regulator
MSALSARQAERVHALSEALLTIHCDADTATPIGAPVLADLRELLGADAVCAYGLRQESDNDRHRVSFLRSLGLKTEVFDVIFPKFVADQRVQWGAYNPGCPEPDQRNRVVTLTSATLRECAIPIALEVFPKIGVGGSDQARVLVCEGPSLLAWVGAWQAAGFEPHQKAMLSAMVPALKKRLQTFRLLDAGPRNHVIEGALESIGRAAFLLASGGRIEASNSTGRELLEQEGRALRGELVAAVKSRAEHPRWSVVPVQGNGCAREWLVIARAWTGERVAAQIARAAVRWRLTPRQCAVLAKVAEGNANQTIGAMLGIAERTVEVHVTALLQKAQVESRAALVASVYTLE